MIVIFYILKVEQKEKKRAEMRKLNHLVCILHYDTTHTQKHLSNLNLALVTKSRIIIVKKKSTNKLITKRNKLEHRDSGYSCSGQCAI